MISGVAPKQISNIIFPTHSILSAKRQVQITLDKKNE